jgi:hypothetical protein
MAACLGHIATSCGFFKHLQAPFLSTVLLLLGHKGSLK